VKDPFSFALLLTILSDPGLMFAIAILAIFFLFLFSAIISASEAAYFSLPPYILDRYRVSSDKRQKLIASILGRPRLLLISFLVLNTLVEITIITLCVLILWQTSLAGLFNGWLVVAALIFCIVVMAIGTLIVPKIFGVRYNISVSQRTIYAWKIWVEILRPFSIFLIKIGRILERKFKQDPAAGDLNLALERATENTLTSRGDADFLRSIVNFGALKVVQVMQPKKDVMAINVEITFAQLIAHVKATGFARLPVYRKTLDSIVGVLYTKDLLPFIGEGEKEYRWQYLIRAGFFVHETKRISSLLKDFQEKHVHMAIVTNDARNTVGIITLEDIVQEIIGNLKEENR
jgi:CBS domain containing-hemolysin-like protein